MQWIEKEIAKSRAGLVTRALTRYFVGWGKKEKPFPFLPCPSPCHQFFVTPVPVTSCDSRLPERKRKRLLRRLKLAQQ